MSNIIWKNSAELEDFSKKFQAREDFFLYGTVEKVSKEGDSVKVKLFDKDKPSYGVWFNVTEDFDVEALKDSEASLLTFTAKIESFLGKDKRYVTKVTLTKWTEAEEEPTNTLLVLSNVRLEAQLPTDQKGLDLVTFKRENPDNDSEFYHIRWYSKEPKVLKPGTATLSFRLGLTKHQIDENGTRKTGIEQYSYEKEGETISGERAVYKLCLTLEYIHWN